MPDDRVERLRGIRTFPQLVKYLRDDLRWPIEAEDFDDLVFDWDPEDLGIDPHNAAKIEQIKQLRPLTDSQPWGIFFVKFEPKNLPIVALRRLLNSVVTKKRQTARNADQRTWLLNDLLFISAYGEEHERHISFAHFSEPPEDRTQAPPSLRVLGWDGEDTELALEHVAYTLESKLSWPSGKPDVDRWRQSWSDAFVLRPREVVQTSQRLAERLAELATAIRRKAQAILKLENDWGPLTQLYKAFQESLLHDLTPDDFSDTYAQTVCYGLFTAAVAKTELGAEEHELAGTLITNPFLREVLESFLHVGGRKRSIDFDELGVQEVVDLLGSPDTHLDSILRDFGNQTRQEDPVMHFYEVFLAKYDKKRKVQRGVFYTPQPVVSYIVRSVHELLQTEFGIEDGLASTITWGEMVKKHEGLTIPDGTAENSPFVQILDPATGTATFLVEVIDVIHRTLIEKWRSQELNPTRIDDRWNEYVPQSLLPRLHGYELMMAPYAIAHLKIGLKLYETGYRFGSPERVRVFLTNALEPASDLGQQKLAGLFPALAHEAQAVNEIKGKQRFTVVVGNPPYSNFGMMNRFPFVLQLLEDYKRDLDEKKLNLDDDFIKFLRLSQYLLETSDAGVLGMITNSVFIDGITHRRMRESQLGVFAKRWVLDLHGSVAKQDRCPDGSLDSNVFDIQQGVCVTLLLRNVTCKTPVTMHRDLCGTREGKYEWLLNNSQSASGWKMLGPSHPYFFLVPKDLSGLEEYTAAPSLLDCFGIQQNAIKTDRDELFIDFDQIALLSRMEKLFTGKFNDSFRARYRIEASSSFDVENRLAQTEFDANNLHTILYRPFDVRWIYYDPKLTSRPAFHVMRHMISIHGNIALLAMRQVASGEAYSHFLVTDTLSDNRTFYSNKGILNVFPLYILDSDELLTKHRVRPNFRWSFLAKLAGALGLGQEAPYGLPSGLTAEAILHFAYALFHCLPYRQRFAEFLKIEYPRIPLPRCLDLFLDLTSLGYELTLLHLLESPKLDVFITTFTGQISPEVVRVGWSNDTVWLDAPATKKGQLSAPGSIGFIGIPEEVWNFHIGGYQVCEKWLKDRKGRVLSSEEITHYQKIVVALSETIRIMAEIDKVIDAHGGWPGAFSGTEPV